MSDYASFVDPTVSRKGSFGKVAIAFAISAILLSISMIILTILLTGLDWIRSFIINS